MWVKSFVLFIQKISLLQISFPCSRPPPAGHHRGTCRRRGARRVHPERAVGAAAVAVVKAHGFGATTQGNPCGPPNPDRGHRVHGRVGHKARACHEDLFGSSRSITITKEDINGDGATDAIQAWYEQIRSILAGPTTNRFDKTCTST